MRVVGEKKFQATSAGSLKGRFLLTNKLKFTSQPMTSIPTHGSGVQTTKCRGCLLLPTGLKPHWPTSDRTFRHRASRSRKCLSRGASLHLRPDLGVLALLRMGHSSLREGSSFREAVECHVTRPIRSARGAGGRCPLRSRYRRLGSLPSDSQTDSHCAAICSYVTP